jgi:hypothetical protein
MLEFSAQQIAMMIQGQVEGDASVTVKNFGKITVSDEFARDVKKKWLEAKSGLFSLDTVIEVGEFTGSIGDITGFIIEPERRYDIALPSGERQLSDEEVSSRIKSIGDILKRMVNIIPKDLKSNQFKS